MTCSKKFIGGGVEGLVNEQKITYLMFDSIKVPIWALNLT